MYKGMSSVEPVVTEPKPKKFEFVNLDEISENTVHNRDQEANETADS
jgi:hypothetical protein